MERRVLIAIFLSFLVLYAYQAFLVKPVPKPATSASGSSTVGTPETSAGPAAPGGAAAAGASTTQGPPAATAPTPIGAAAGQGLAAPPAPTTAPVIGSGEERDVRVETAQDRKSTRLNSSHVE